MKLFSAEMLSGKVEAFEAKIGLTMLGPAESFDTLTSVDWNGEAEMMKPKEIISRREPR